MSDRIHIKNLIASTVLGVPEEERMLPQSVSINASLTLMESFHGISDELDQTVDYFQIYQKIREVAAKGERQLLESLAEDLAQAILSFERINAVDLEVEKFILPNCGSVSVEIHRSKLG